MEGRGEGNQNKTLGSRRLHFYVMAALQASAGFKKAGVIC